MIFFFQFFLLSFLKLAPFTVPLFYAGQAIDNRLDYRENRYSRFYDRLVNQSLKEILNYGKLLKCIRSTNFVHICNFSEILDYISQKWEIFKIGGRVGVVLWDRESLAHIGRVGIYGFELHLSEGMLSPKYCKKERQ